jgi:small subunit ribosomal protein S7
MAYKKFTASVGSLAPDPVYHSRLVSKFINSIMYDGKKAVAERVVYGALKIIGDKMKDVTPLAVFEKAIDNVKPAIEVRSKRVGGANYQVPMQVNSKRALSLSMRWLRDAIRAGKGGRTAQKLATELMAAYKGEGAAMTSRENVHRMAEANKAFAHFAW